MMHHGTAGHPRKLRLKLEGLPALACTFWIKEKAIRLPMPMMPTFAAPRGMLPGRMSATESAILSPARAIPASQQCMRHKMSIQLLKRGLSCERMFAVTLTRRHFFLPNPLIHLPHCASGLPWEL